MDMNSGSILIVDDESTARSILSRHVQKSGYSATAVEDGRKALELIGKRSFELVLLDLKMPGIDGIEVLKTLRQQYSQTELPVIVVSVIEEDQGIASALQWGANDYIQKPIKSAVLAARIEAQIASKQKAKAYQKIKKKLERVIKKRSKELGLVNETLEQERKLFDYLLSSSPAITYLSSVDSNHNCIFISKNIYSILGYQRDEILGTNFWDEHIHPEHKTQIILEIERNLSNGGGNSEYRLLHSDGRYRWMHDKYLVIKENDVPVEIVGSLIDITEHKKLISEISYKTSHDALTGLINRHEFERHLESILRWPDPIQHVLCYMDLDEFKIINNTHGHVAGDELLRQMSALLRQTLSRRDIVAYLGGDEFGILLQHCALDQAQRILEKIREALTEFRFKWDGKKHVITASIGVLAIDEHVDRQSDFLSAAVSACDMAKEAGHNRVQIYVVGDDQVKERRQEMLWVEKVNRALEEDRFLLFYQPIVPISDDTRGKHFELLIRMKDDAGDLVAPGFFLPAVERYHLSTKIDRWVVQTTFSWLDAHREYLETDYKWGINLSGQSLADTDLLQFVCDQLEINQIPPDRIYFEITETAAIANLNDAIHFINTLREKGCQFALDDFGSGLSSFSYLKNLPVDYLKIDGVFVKDMADNDIDCAMVKAINDVGQAMGMRTIAEFVENADILEKLRHIGVDYAQGYGISRPKPLHEFEPE
ncbi:MAG: EAL domain-containing protein [Proteobacteria bacterium]|nr:EAL domain-containing protein [Pseudomonadota bacterium]